MVYKSKFKGKQIDDYLDSIGTKQDKLVDGVNIATVNGQSLTNGGDVTIEAGTYSKPTDGIPASDLESDILNKLNKIDSLNAGMEDTDETAEDVVSLPFVSYIEQELTEEQKEQARENIGIDGALSNKVIDHGTDDTVVTLTPNAIHRWDFIESLTINIPEDSEEMLSTYRIIFSADSNSVLSLPANILWANDEALYFTDAGDRFEINIIGNLASWNKYFNPHFLTYAENPEGVYVNTDYVISTDDYGVECKIEKLAGGSTSYAAFAGTRSGAGTEKYSVAVGFDISTNKSKIYWNGAAHTIGSYSEGVPYELSYSGESNAKTNVPMLKLFCCASANDDTMANYGTGRIYYFRILGSNGELRLNLLPGKNERGVVGFWDTVSKKFYAPANGELIGV